MLPDAAMKRDLAWLAEPRLILDTSSWWPRITAWQRAGLVRLAWGGTRLACHVELTPKGREVAGVG